MRRLGLAKSRPEPRNFREAIHPEPRYSLASREAQSPSASRERPGFFICPKVHRGERRLGHPKKRTWAIERQTDAPIVRGDPLAIEVQQELFVGGAELPLRDLR